MKKSAHLIFIFLLSFFLFSCNNSKGELKVYSTCLQAYTEAVCQKFEKDTGIKTTCEFYSNKDILEMSENNRCSADVWFGGTQDPYNKAGEMGFLYPYKAKNASHLIDQKYKDKNDYWYGIYLGVLGFFWNSNELEKRNIMPPVDWDDLLKPEYQGLIVFGNPKTSGTGALIINTIIQLYGKDAAMEYFRQLDKNVLMYTAQGVQPALMIPDNQAAIGIGFMHDILRQMIVEGKNNIGMTTPISGTPCEIGATAIFKNSTNLKNAKKFIEFALSPDCVNLAHKNGSYQLLLLDNAQPVEQAISLGLDKIETIDYDLEDAKLNGDSYIESFFKVIKNDERVKYR